MKKLSAKIILFYKPYGVVSQFTPIEGHSSLAEFHLPKGVYPAGRLDSDSEGLLLLTNSGDIQHHLTDPKFEHPKTYWAQVENIPNSESLEKLAKGLLLKDGMTKPCVVSILLNEPSLPPRDPPIRFRKNIPTAWIELTLKEGKNRQVRRMAAAIGHPALRLVRARIGAYDLKGLVPGRWRYVDEEIISDWPRQGLVKK